MKADIQHARVELLKSLAVYALWVKRMEKKEATESDAGVVDIRTGMTVGTSPYPSYVPLWEEEWDSKTEEIEIAVKEARALGDIDYEPPQQHGVFILGPYVKITTRGMAWLRSVGEMPELRLSREGTTP